MGLGRPGEARAGLEPGCGFQSGGGRQEGGGRAQGALGALDWGQAALKLTPVAAQNLLFIQAPGKSPRQPWGGPGVRAGETTPLLKNHLFCGRDAHTASLMLGKAPAPDLFAPLLGMSRGASHIQGIREIQQFIQSS